MSESDRTGSSQIRANKIAEDPSHLHKLLAIVITLFVVYSSFTLELNIRQRRALFLLLVIIYLLVRFPLAKTIERDVSSGQRTALYTVDSILLVLSTVSYSYLIVYSEEILMRSGLITDTEVVLGIFAVFIVLELTRRTVNNSIPLIVTVFLVYAVVGQHVPGLLSHPGFRISTIVESLYLAQRGLFSFPLAVMLDYVYLFVLFGALLEYSGGGRAFLDLAKRIVGKVKGGPAKLTVVASGFMGMLSGSAVANTLTTGAFTIPTMKKQGYERNFAAGVESAASTGGQLMPPVMGAAIFIMVDVTGIPYIDIIVHAILPAVIFFTTIYLAVHFQSYLSDFSSLPDDEVPDWKPVLLRLYYFVPVVIFVFLLYDGYSIQRSIMYSTIVLLGVTMISPESRPFDPRRESDTLTSNPLVDGVERTAFRAAPIVVAATAIGVLLGVLGLTGTSLKITAIIVDISHQSLLLALVLTMILCIIFGTAMDTITVYILLAILVAPALVEIGVTEIAAHLFIFYFGMMAMVTPPVCLAAYAAATIAESDPIRSGIWAFKLSLAAFILPFAFVLNPPLLMIGTTGEILLAFITAMIGSVGLAGAAVGHFYKPVHPLARMGMFVSGGLLLLSGTSTDLIGGAIFLAVLLITFWDSLLHSKISNWLVGR